MTALAKICIHNVDPMADCPVCQGQSLGPPKRIVWENFATGASGDLEVEKAFLRRFGAMYDTFCAKQRDYGRGNIAKFGAQGVLVRLSDKVERLINLQRSGALPANEAVGDSWQDAAVYGIIGLMCLQGEWPGSPEATK